MATSFSNHSISLAAAHPTATVPSRPVSASAAPVRPRTSPNLRCSSRYLTLQTVPIARMRLGVSRAGSDPKMMDEEDNDQLGQSNFGNDAYSSLDMQALVQMYKEAVINGDEKGIPELEASISNIEKEKNELLNKITEITAEIASGKDRFLRLNADFENFRKRSDKDRLSFTSDIQGEVIESLLPLVDNFERVKQQIVPETEKEKKITTSYQGIYKQFVEIMRALRVSVVETVGKQFDPLVHEAVARVDSHKFREGTVLQEVQRGFLLGDRILRPAKVKVSNGPSSKNSVPIGEKPAEQPNEVAESDAKEISVADRS